jgi:hypothetical protein
MTKLITTYLATPTLKNAKKVEAYARQHMMARCTLTQLELGVLANAIDHVNRGS